MKNLTNPTWIITKGFLFLFLGLLSGGLLFFERPTLKTFVLIAVAVWSFCRFYYFGFYVLERYVDPNYKFSGLISMVQYVVWGRKGQIAARQGEKT
ncbi:MAG TPA: hypothetical protein VG075_15370 [Candidatus Acidoferrum sp.]|nr:hypothetical protein [Candidatus Acidoferrum sp.]